MRAIRRRPVRGPDHRVPASGVHQRVAGAQHDVEPLVDGVRQIRPQALLDRDRQPFPPEPRRRNLDHRVASVGRPDMEAPAGKRRRIDACAAGRVEHRATGTHLPEQVRHGGPGDSQPIGQGIVVIEPVVVDSKATVVVGHEALTSQTPS